jgi:hypothetical protein
VVEQGTHKPPRRYAEVRACGAERNVLSYGLDSSLGSPPGKGHGPRIAVDSAGPPQDKWFHDGPGHPRAYARTDPAWSDRPFERSPNLQI